MIMEAEREMTLREYLSMTQG
ncbi:MAG: hypothetical protein H6Q48_2312, partial [Deltaproteobacteria bacterium]|nr:hypothetical protein [Deltaproteobacteria bacterium]